MRYLRNLRDWLEALVILLAMLAIIAMPHPKDAGKETASPQSVAGVVFHPCPEFVSACLLEGLDQ